MTLRDLIGDVLRTLWVHKLRTFLTMFGIAWAALVWHFDPQFLPWLLPIVGAFVLSVPLSVFTSRTGAGRALRRPALGAGDGRATNHHDSLARAGRADGALGALRHAQVFGSKLIPDAPGQFEVDGDRQFSLHRVPSP